MNPILDESGESCPVLGQNKALMALPAFQEGASASVDMSSFEEFNNSVCAIEGAEEKIDAPPFFNPGDPATILQREKPHHRAICILAAQGLTRGEIADQTGWHPTTIAYVLRQPWALTYVANVMEKSGRTLIMNQLQGVAANAARLLIESVDPTNPLGLKPDDRVKNAHKYLEKIGYTAPEVHKFEGAEEMSKEELEAIVAGRQ
jgi:hypothetical protein